jgi:hypothetical protein
VDADADADADADGLIVSLDAEVYQKWMDNYIPPLKQKINIIKKYDTQ